MGLTEAEMMDTLNVLLLSHEGTAEDLARIHELNPANVKISAPEGPGRIDGSIAVLSWRWDLHKKDSLEDMADVVSQKVIKFIFKARDLGFKWAWCDYVTVPQYSDSSDELMKHIKASRTLYQRCSVLMVDVETVYPGLHVPSMDYQTRLWIAAEKSAVLVNPNVTISDYVQVDVLNHMTIVLALQGPWATVNYSMAEYQNWMDALTGRSPELLDSYVGRLKLAEALNIIVFNMGYTCGSRPRRALVPRAHVAPPPPASRLRRHLEARYPGLPPFLVSAYQVKLADTRHTTMEPPISAAKQEALIAAYYVERPDDDPQARPGAVIREPKGRDDPNVAALLAEVARKDKMEPGFSHYDHYTALLLLASEVFYHLRQTSKFDPKGARDPQGGLARTVDH